MNRRALVVVLLTCAALYAAMIATRPITPAVPGLAARTEGAFQRDGQYPGDALPHAAGVRVWGSWAGSDENTGTLTLGPLAAPARLRIAVNGYPTQPGNALSLERADTKASAPIAPLFDVGTAWHIVDFFPPPDWIGQPVNVVARDNAKTVGGWLALTEPIRGGPGGERHAEFFTTLCAGALNGLLLGLVWLAASRQLAARAGIAPHWTPLVAAAAVAACGYAAFWAYFAGALPGKIFSLAVLVAGAVGAWRTPATRDSAASEVLFTAKILCAIVLFDAAVLHFFPSSREFYNLTANRWVALTGDNTLPHNAARALFQGEPLRQPGADWLSSDRPPLQTGWLLLPWPVTAVLGVDERAAGGTAAVWFQSLWVFAAYGLLRTFGLARSRAAAWTALLACSGFFLLNTMFTWPKLAAAAFACGAFGLWAPRENGAMRTSECLLGAALAGLAWLAHGGVAFSFLALAPWLAWRALRGEWRAWAQAATVFALFALPWIAYQKFYDPPGNRLFKWHLGGVIPKDERGTWETIRDSYRALTWRELATQRAANFTHLFEGDWNWWRDFSFKRAGDRRNNEFFLLARALTWWLLGLAALPIVLARRRWLGAGRVHLALAAWTLATIVLWCALMFIPGSTVIHQGSYAAMLALFVLLSAWLELAGPWLLFLVGGLELASFATTWAVSDDLVHGPLNFAALALSLIAIATLVVVVVGEHRVAREKAGQPPG